jgi:hypothetical protein
MKNAILVAIAFCSAAAVAAPLSGLTIEQPICYGREYAAKHMEAHPLQTVRQLRLKFFKDEHSGDSVVLSINAEIKRGDIYKPYATGMGCTPNRSGSKLECFIDCDGGRAKVNLGLRQNADEITFINEGFVMYGGCGEETDEMIWLNATRGGDDIFKLYQLRKEYCQK